MVAPDTRSLESGTALTFKAKGYRPNGKSAAIGVNWTATGGAIDAGGRYTAGPVRPAAFQVIATNAAGDLADTSVVTVIGAGHGPRAAGGSRAGARRGRGLAGHVRPLGTSATHQFAAYGRNTAGDSVVVPVSFHATGGTITSSGLFTAGGSSGTFRVIASSAAMSDTAVVTVTAPTAPAPIPSPTRDPGRLRHPVRPVQRLGRHGPQVEHRRCSP